MEKTKVSWGWYAILLLAFLGVIALVKYCTPTRQSITEQENLVSALQDTVKFYKNRDSISTATIQTITTESMDNFTQLTTSNEEIRRLQQAVESYKGQLKAGSAVVVGSVNTRIKHKAPTKIIPVSSTLEYRTDSGLVSDNQPDTNSTYLSVPANIYVSSDSTEWLQYSIIAAPDTTTFDLKVHNEFTAALGYDVKTKKPFVDLTLLNPYSEVKSLRSYQVTVPKAKPKRWGIGLQGGGTYTIDKFRPYFGAGISYNFITF